MTNDPRGYPSSVGRLLGLAERLTARAAHAVPGERLADAIIAARAPKLLGAATRLAWASEERPVAAQPPVSWPGQAHSAGPVTGPPPAAAAPEDEAVSYTQIRAHQTEADLVFRLLV
jgi:hypothetical protein